MYQQIENSALQKAPRVLIVGGGAAGYFAAITCAEKFPEAVVEIAEATNRTLKKVQISGGGRCNVTHHCFDPAELVKKYPRGYKELRSLFARFQPQDTIEWFHARGVELKTEADGRIFPSTDSSHTIMNCLENAALTAGVKISRKLVVLALRHSTQGFQVEFSGNHTAVYEQVLLATGSHPSGYKLATSLGHSIESLAPSLFTFKIVDPRLEHLAGLSFPAVVLELRIGEKKFSYEAGPLLITHWGLSGPVVLKLSAWAARELLAANYQAELQINFFPDKKLLEVEVELKALKEKYSRRLLQNAEGLPLPHRYWEKILDFLDIPVEHTWAQISHNSLQRIATELTQAKFLVTGKGIFKDEFVTCGGLRLSEIDLKTMQSKLVPGLFFAGELLDIDGITGGFNFQNAWTTGWVAGQNLGQKKTN